MPHVRPEVFLRIGSHAEKQYILKTLKLFDGLIAGANLLESTPGATVSLALKIMGSLKKQFVIDPMTYVFGMDLSYIQSETIDKTSGRKGAKKIGLKKSFSNLVMMFGKPISSVVVDKQRPVAPADFDATAIERLAKAVHSYQLNRMREVWQSDPQFSEFIKELHPPSFTLAPYFYTPYGESAVAWQEWHKLNRALATAHGALAGDEERHAVVAIGPRILASKQDALKVVTEYIDTGCAALWFWFSAIDEAKIASDRLQVLVAIVNLLRDAKRKAYNMHGGFLSALLSKNGMTGFSHGVGYGESKDVIPVIGVTVPTVNYHLPPLHVRVPILEVQRALGALGVEDADDFHAKICDCTVCKGILEGNLDNLSQFGDFVLKVGNTRQSQTPDSAKKCRFHFLLARHKEISNVGSSTAEALKQELLGLANEYEKLPSYLGLSSRAGHLKVWASAL